MEMDRVIDGEQSRKSREDDVLPDERQIITERIADLNELDGGEFLNVDKLADVLGFERP